MPPPPIVGMLYKHALLEAFSSRTLATLQFSSTTLCRFPHLLCIVGPHRDTRSCNRARTLVCSFLVPTQTLSLFHFDAYVHAGAYGTGPGRRRLIRRPPPDPAPAALQNKVDFPAQRDAPQTSAY